MKYLPSLERARITEMFSSLQGEGPRMGERHLFIRFEACHMACAYCDETEKKAKEMSLAAILNEVAKLERKSGPHTCVSLTGGEPLLYADFLKLLCPALKKRRFRILLETSGVLWQQFAKVVGACDVIAMDLKLSSVTRQKEFLEEHRKFLKLARRKEIYIKVVVSKNVDLREYDKHLRMVAQVAPHTPVFLQPMSRGKKVYPDPALMRFLDELQRTGAKRLSDVRVGIQLQKLMNIR
ncbi:MAG: 7-carboxy-7-deazaguanine synthase QueE [Candidatus Omnitrophota bacterium]